MPLLLQIACHVLSCGNFLLSYPGHTPDYASPSSFNGNTFFHIFFYFWDVRECRVQLRRFKVMVNKPNVCVELCCCTYQPNNRSLRLPYPTLDSTVKTAHFPCPASHLIDWLCAPCITSFVLG